MSWKVICHSVTLLTSPGCLVFVVAAAAEGGPCDHDNKGKKGLCFFLSCEGKRFVFFFYLVFDGHRLSMLSAGPSLSSFLDWGISSA